MQVDLRYLPGFVPGSQHVFRPASIAVPPTTEDPAAADSDLGAIYAADGTTQASLAISDASGKFNKALIKGLADAGLVPVALGSNPVSGKPPQGSDFILYSNLERIEVNKRFGAKMTVHGQYFTMMAVVRAKFELRNRDGAVLYAGEISGLENEPPTPVGGEVFLPLETEPAESLSVALSRAVGLLMLEPGFRDALPMRPVQSSPLATPMTPTPAASPSVGQPAP
jgi:hypothetical protein